MHEDCGVAYSNDIGTLWPNRFMAQKQTNWLIISNLELDFKITTPPAPPQPTIVHLSIRPFLPPSEDDTLKKKSRASIVRRGFSRHPTVTGGGQEFGQGGGGPDGRRTSGQPEDGANAGGCCGCVIC